MWWWEHNLKSNDYSRWKLRDGRNERNELHVIIGIRIVVQSHRGSVGRVTRGVRRVGVLSPEGVGHLNEARYPV